MTSRLLLACAVAGAAMLGSPIAAFGETDRPIASALRRYAGREALAMTQTRSAPVPYPGRPARRRTWTPIVVGAGIGCGALGCLAHTLAEVTDGEPARQGLVGCAYGAAWGAAIGWLFSLR